MRNGCAVFHDKQPQTAGIVLTKKIYVHCRSLIYRGAKIAVMVGLFVLMTRTGALRQSRFEEAFGSDFRS